MMHGLHPASLVKTLDVKFLVDDGHLLNALMRAGVKAQQTEPVISNLLERIRREGEAGHDFHREMCALHLTEILIHFLRLARKQPGTASVEEVLEDTPAGVFTQRAVSFIQDHYAEELDLRSISKAWENPIGTFAVYSRNFWTSPICGMSCNIASGNRKT